MADPLSVTASIVAVLQLSSTVLKYLVDVKNAPADRKSLIRELSSTRGILSTLNETVDYARVSDETWSATIRSLEDPDGPLRVLTTTLQQLATTLNGSASATGIKKAANSLRWPFKQSEVEKILRVIERQKSTLSLALENDHIALSREICNNTEAIRDDVAGLSREFVAVRLDVKTDAENAILNQLPYADGAPFNAFRRDYERDCLPDTRVELLNQITTWGDTSDGPCLFWLNGMAGTGKSTISRTVARRFADQRRLGASFFFSRGQGDLSHAEKFFTTIASQIAHVLPALKRHICEAIADDPRIGTQGLGEQWRKLIFRPLSKLENLLSHRLPIILVIDALDECKQEDRKNDIQVILQLLAEAKDLPTIQLKIFLTSRLEVSIDDGFSAISNLIHQDFILHHISNDIIEHDILIFIQHEFERIRRERDLLSDWPKAKDINSLVQDANGLFIYAATICRFINRRHPEKQLSIILQCMGSSPPTLRTSPTRNLDEMYSQVLKSSIYTNYDEEEREELVDLFKQIVGSIVILLDTLSATALTSLLNLPRRDVDEILKHVQAVLDVPSTPDLPVRLLHPSFGDFLLDNKRCIERQFWIDDRQAHRTLADDCIRLMSNSLKQDVCKQEAPGTLAADVESSRIEQCFPPEVRYACLYWIQHLQKSDAQLYDNDQVHQFLQTHLLHWLEALSWMGKTSEGILAILSLEAQIQADESPKLYDFVHDAKRFASYNRSVIEQAPLQIYCSALVFAPDKSIVRKKFEDCIPPWVQMKTKLQANWNATLQTLEGHTDRVNATAFSPDGKQLASASNDRTVRIWDASTGSSQQTLEGHTSKVNDVVFSPNCEQLASASVDSTVRLWNAATANDITLQTLKGHTASVRAVVFSPDSKQLASASGDGTVRLWNATTGTVEQTLKGHTSWVTDVAFSPDSKQVASASGDQTVRLWDAATGTMQQRLEGHNDCVIAVAFSLDGKQLASASYDHTVRLWDIATGVTQQTLKGHTSIVHDVIFSPDGTQLASSSSDETVRLWDAAVGTIKQTLIHNSPLNAVAFSPDSKQLVTASKDLIVRLWDAATGSVQQMLEGHTDFITAVAFSPDGKQLASASDDQTVRLWDATNTAQQPLKGHTSSVGAVAFSPDGKWLASASDDQTVQLWDVATGLVQQILKGHKSFIGAVAFSPNGKQLASASYDATVRLWDPAIGTAQQTLKGHTSWVWAVVFSPDGKQLASASCDHTVRVWDAATGIVQRTLKGHNGYVLAVAFSPDGKLLASSSYDWTVRLWDTSIGTALQTLKVEADLFALTFSMDGSCLESNGWAMQIRPSISSNITTQTIPTTKLSIKDKWITEEEGNLIMLPADYQPNVTAVYKNTIAIGHRLGKVLVLEVRI